MSKLKIYVFMLLIGFICLALDINVDSGISYPEYKNSSDVTGEYQYNNIASNYNAHCTYKMIETASKGDDGEMYYTSSSVIDEVFLDTVEIDIFNDFIGYLLIFIACLGFRKSSSRFLGGAIFSALGIILHIGLNCLPFIVNGLPLCNIALAVGLAYLACFIICGFLVGSGLCRMCPGVVCRDERKWGQLMSFVVIVAHMLITFIYWVSTDFAPLRTVGHFFVFVEVSFIIGFAVILKRADYIFKENFKE